MNDVTMIGDVMASFKDVTGNPTRMQAHKSTILTVGGSNEPTDRCISVYMFFEGQQYNGRLSAYTDSKRVVVTRLEYEADDFVIAHCDKTYTEMLIKDRLQIIEDGVSKLVEVIELPSGIPTEDDVYWESDAGLLVKYGVGELIAYGRALNMSHSTQRININIEGYPSLQIATPPLDYGSVWLGESIE